MIHLMYNSRCIKLRKHFKTHIVGKILGKSGLAPLHYYFVKLSMDHQSKMTACEHACKPYVPSFDFR